uniref:Uncharacterized protein n=1 Tax=Physcomitrium patens TaxID=3218 RepID=A0A2K1JYN3_PHYPA|nr:hypothetical protein PHYPA_013764 [Physcomitrium patens]
MSSMGLIMISSLTNHFHSGFVVPSQLWCCVFFVLTLNGPFCRFFWGEKATMWLFNWIFLHLLEGSSSVEWDPITRSSTLFFSLPKLYALGFLFFIFIINILFWLLIHVEL